MELPRISTGALVGGAVALGSIASVGAVAIAKSRKRKAKKRSTNTHKTIRSSSHRSRKGRKLKFGSKAYRKKYLKKHGRRKPQTQGKRQDTSHRRIRYTKNNQPYIILKNGRARFISKKSVSHSRRRKGGKY